MLNFAACKLGFTSWTYEIISSWKGPLGAAGDDFLEARATKMNRICNRYRGATKKIYDEKYVVEIMLAMAKADPENKNGDLAEKLCSCCVNSICLHNDPNK